MPEIVVDLKKTVSRIERQQDMRHAYYDLLLRDNN